MSLEGTGQNRAGLTRAEQYPDFHTIPVPYCGIQYYRQCTQGAPFLSKHKNGLYFFPNIFFMLTNAIKLLVNCYR